MFFTPGTNTLWNKLTGDRAEFSMENRAFNYTSLISFLLLFYFLFFELYLGASIMALIEAVLIIVLGALYYYSRVKKKYKRGIIIYAFCSYIALSINYFANSGINGPTIILLLITFNFLIGIGQRGMMKWWILLHVGTMLSLLLVEYYHPELVPDTYQSRKIRFIDIGSSYVGAIGFIYFIVNYVRGYYHKERLVAQVRSKAIMEQNEQILAQNRMLEQVNTEKNKLFSIISHDFKTPLDSIKGYLDVLSKEPLEPEEKAAIEAELAEQTKYTTNLLQNLLSWARAQMDGINAQLVPLHLNELILQITSDALSTAARKNIKLTTAVGKGLEIVGDKDMLLIVLRNLLNNAIKFTPQGGEITISAHRNGDKAVISVRDTGVGIHADKQAELFTFKMQSTFGTNNEKGIGLGLMMCKEFIEYQRGAIWFESMKGHGSVFFVSLPLTKA
jgi:signal transduction histidine kinase